MLCILLLKSSVNSIGAKFLFLEFTVDVPARLILKPVEGGGGSPLGGLLLVPMVGFCYCCCLIPVFMLSISKLVETTISKTTMDEVANLYRKDLGDHV